MVRRVLFVVAVFLVLGGTAQANGITFRPGAPGIGDPYFPLDGKGFGDGPIAFDPSNQRLNENRCRVAPHDPTAEPAVADVERQDFLIGFRFRSMIQPDHHAKVVFRRPVSDQDQFRDLEGQALWRRRKVDDLHVGLFEVTQSRRGEL